MTVPAGELVLNSSHGEVKVVNEPDYRFGSADNMRRYDNEIRLDDSTPYSIHGVRIDGRSSVIFGAGGGPSGVHERSAVEVDGQLILAVGNQVVCLSIATGRMEWSLVADWASCFGVYWDARHQALISHGELQIARLSLKGEKMWATEGRDIFTEGFRCLPSAIEAIDFNHDIYLLDYLTGRVLNHHKLRG